MRKNTEKIVSVLIVLSMLGNFLPVNATIQTKKVMENKISEELQSTMNKIEKSNSPNDKVKIFLWYNDINQEQVKKQVESETGLTKETLDTELAMPDKKILDKLSEISDDENYNGIVDEEIEAYLKDTQKQRMIEKIILKSTLNVSVKYQEK